MLERLRDQDAVEGIAVQWWQDGEVCQGSLFERQRHDPVGFALY